MPASLQVLYVAVSDAKQDGGKRFQSLQVCD